MDDMAPKDLTVKILREIRDEIRKTNARLDGTNGRLDSTNDRVEAMGKRLDNRITETTARLDDRITQLDLRLGSELVAVNASLREVVGLLRERRDEWHRLDRHEERLADLDGRVRSLESVERPGR
jgi:chromosome segregation ATPase